MHIRLLAAALLTAGSALAQGPTIAIGAGVDTSARLNHEVFALWRGYLGERPDTGPGARWVTDERARMPTPDLTSTWLYTSPAWARGLTATVVDLGPEPLGDTTTFVVRTLFTRADSGVVRPLALLRVYVVRDPAVGGRWALANALPRLTRDWARRRVGRVQFVYAPTRRPDTTLARRAARFVDSAATALGTAPNGIDYYLASSPREMMRVLGVDLAASPNTGRVYAEDAIAVAGSPTTTEWNTHDLAHLVAAPIAGGTRAPRWWNEGVATWIGGRGGRDFATLVRQLDADLAQNAGRTLDSVLAPHAWRDTISTTAAAVLVRMAFERGGRAAVQRMVNAPDESPEGIRRAAAFALGVRPEAVAEQWRRAVTRYSR